MDFTDATTIALALMLALQLADFASTWRAIHIRGGSEANPVVAWLIARFGLVPGLILAKGGVGVGTVLLWWGGYGAVLWAAVAVYAVIVVRNLKI